MCLLHLERLRPLKASPLIPPSLLLLLLLVLLQLLHCLPLLPLALPLLLLLVQQLLQPLQLPHALLAAAHWPAWQCVDGDCHVVRSHVSAPLRVGMKWGGNEMRGDGGERE